MSTEPETRKFGDKLEELDLSHEEIDRLTKCMKDEKFRDLLREYAEEISDPDNRKRYEEEIAMLEKDRGMDVKFINPKPGHVIKTSVNGSQKCFINICTNENLGQPQSRPSVQGSTRGMQWSIPHSVSQAREDVDKAGAKCMVYDVVFHPDTYYLLQRNERFKKMIHDTALDAVERQFGVKLDKVNIRIPKMTFKGLPMSSVIRTPLPQGSQHPKDPQEMEDVDVRLRSPLPEVKVNPDGSMAATNGASTPTPKSSTKSKTVPNLKEESKKAKEQRERAQNEKGKNKEEGFIEPKYTITHRGHFDMQDYHVASANVVQDTWPKELVVSIDLPLLSAANTVNLEIFERHLHLDSVKPAKYKLDFKLPYPVAQNKGFAKFDKSRHRLQVTLEVLPAPPPPNLAPFTSPPLVAEVDATEEDKEDVADCDIKTTEDSSKPKTCSGGKSDCEETLLQRKGDKTSTPKQTTAVPTEPKSPSVKPKKTKNEKLKSKPPKPKQPSFVEEGRRHYQEGNKWKDNDEYHEIQNPPDNPPPLTKNSAFLIDMVMKYDGLIRRCPQYAFHQDEHFVTFIIEVPHIFEESLWYAVYDRMLQFCCLSECLNDEMVNSVFQLWIEFGEGQKIDPQRSRVDVSGNNAVFCLRKLKANEEWHEVKAGFDRENLDVRRFSTIRNVCDLYTLVYKHAEGITATPIAVCKVVREEKDLLILELEAKEGNPKVNGKSETMITKQKICEKSEPFKREEVSKPDKVHTDQVFTEDEPTKKETLPEPSTAKGQPSDKPAKEKIDSHPVKNNDKRSKKTSFAEDVKKHTVQMGNNEDVDSDDEEQQVQEKEDKSNGQKTTPVQGIVTIAGEEKKEIIVDHVTKSIVKLSADSLIYELDDDI